MLHDTHKAPTAPVGVVRRLWRVLTVMLLALAGQSCANDAWEDVPSTAYDFCMRYWPEYAIQTYGNMDGVQVVVIKGAATVYFDQASQWIRIDGNGGTLPPMLMWDQLPGPLYSYLQEIDAVRAVYGLARNSSTYAVTLATQTVSYNVETGVITGSQVEP